MIIFGTALLATCYLAGVLVGEAIASVIGVKANVGGVGIAMIFLIAAQHFMRKRGWFPEQTERGVVFWAMLYIPVVVAMAATQNVIVAAKAGPVALISAAGAFGLCVLFIAFINRIIERAHIASAPLDEQPEYSDAAIENAAHGAVPGAVASGHK